MTDFNQDKIGFKKAIYLALTVLCIYYPIIISANIPLGDLRNAKFVVIPAFIHLVFYTLLILAIDQVITFVAKRFGPEILELKFRTIGISLIVAVGAVVVSQILFRANYKLLSLVRTLINSLDLHDGTFRPPPLWIAIGRSNYALTLVISISIFYLLLNRRAHSRLRTMEIQTEQLRKENAIARYEALKNQVSPHFLFNSLSILSSLVYVDPQLSEQFIDRLSKAYRYILENKDNETVTLETELGFVESYAFLLKIRFEQKFNVTVSMLPSDAFHYRIAPMTLQLLIENCVKHNRMSKEEPLLITIDFSDSYLIISNPLRPRSDYSASLSTGVGMTNLIKRYQLLSTKPVIVEKLKDLFIVKIPLL